MGAGIAILAVTFQRGAVVRLSEIELPLLEIDIAQREMMVRFVEMVNLRLQFLDTTAGVGAGKFEATRGRVRAAIDIEKIPERAEPGKREDEDQPEPFLPANRIDDHPHLKDREQQHEGRRQQK